MKTAIIGSPQAGQQELFCLLTQIDLDMVRQKPLDVHLGICEVKDPRIDQLVKIFNPKKITYARIEYMLLPGFNLKQMKNADEICWVTLLENAEADIANFVAEMIISDLMLIEKRLENIAKDQKRKFDQQREKEKQFMELCKKQLDQEKSLSLLSFSPEQAKEIKTYQFLTMKPIIIVVNVPEDKINDSAITENIIYPSVQLSIGLESEINQLDPADRGAFMQEMGIDQPAVEKMSIMAYEGLGLISFFTVGEDEVRAWTIRKNSTAAQAGGAIHSDIEKGFVRAEMCCYQDLLAAGSEAKLKEKGKYHLKGRDYIVQDGDVLAFRFNV